MKRKGAQPKNRNAEKAQTKKAWATRLPETTIAQIKENARKLGISQAKYIEKLVIANKV